MLLPEGGEDILQPASFGNKYHKFISPFEEDVLPMNNKSLTKLEEEARLLTDIEMSLKRVRQDLDREEELLKSTRSHMDRKTKKRLQKQRRREKLRKERKKRRKQRKKDKAIKRIEKKKNGVIRKKPKARRKEKQVFIRVRINNSFLFQSSETKPVSIRRCGDALKN